MIAHVIFFRLRDNVPASERSAILDAYACALRDIPSIRRVQVGSRVRIGREYESQMNTDFPYAGILEFDSVEDLRAYLNHPAHEKLATLLFAAIAETLIYDFKMETTVDGLRGMLDERQ